MDSVQRALGGDDGMESSWNPILSLCSFLRTNTFFRLPLFFFSFFFSFRLLLLRIILEKSQAVGWRVYTVKCSVLYMFERVYIHESKHKHKAFFSFESGKEKITGLDSVSQKGMAKNGLWEEGRSLREGMIVWNRNEDQAVLSVGLFL